MSISFYYVVTYNVRHETVKKFLGSLFAVSESLMEFKIRSKMFHDFADAQEAAHSDFDMKCEKLYDTSEPGEQELRWVTAINPKFCEEVDPTEEACVTDDWSDSCAGAIFFLEAEPGDDDDEDGEDAVLMEPDSWMFKYEIFFIEDVIGAVENGESAFCASLCTTSSYH